MQSEDKKQLFLVMVTIITILAFIELCCPNGFSQTITIKPAEYRYHGQWLLPNEAVSPGDVRTQDTSELCNPKFRTGKYRKTTHKMKVDVCRAYGIMTGCPGKEYELDHIISLTVGGNDSEKNLYPQPILQARIKDRLERTLGTTHGLVCQGKVSIQDAQHWLSDDWVVGYEMVFKKAPELKKKK